MTTTYIAFYIGKKEPSNENKLLWNPKATLIDRFICWVDGSPFSHAELVLSLGKDGYGDCVSSSNRDDGVRRKYIYLLDGRWHIIPVPIDQQQVLRIYQKYKDAKYDYLGLGSTKWAWFPNIPSRLFCIEFIAKALGKVDAENWGVKRLYDWAVRSHPTSQDGVFGGES